MIECAAYVAVLHMYAIALLLEEQPRRRQQRRVRIRNLNPHVSLFGMSDNEVRRRFRLPPHVILETLQIVRNDLVCRLNSRTAIPPLTQLLVVLRFCASGSIQTAIGSVTGIPRSSFNQVLRVVLRAFLLRVHQFISMPLDEEALVSVKQQFAALAGFPHVVGAVGSMRRALGNHSINIQIICDASHLIRDVVAKYPGSYLDSNVMRQSAIWQTLEQRHRRGVGDEWLLGDCEYTLTPFLLTPILNPTTEQHVSYNRAHTATRQVVDHTIGLLKERFRFLDWPWRAFVYGEHEVCLIACLCCIFHNLAVRNRAPLEEVVSVDANQEEDIAGSSAFQESVVRRYF